AAGFVGYGGAGGTRAVEHLRLVMGELMVADVRAQVALSLYTDFENFSVFKPAPHHEKSVHDVLDQVIAWGGAQGRCAFGFEKTSNDRREPGRVSCGHG